ncbi:hypothetical protein GC176_14695 [bacterium]|nr:hypothetical protein [bacterium]
MRSRLTPAVVIVVSALVTVSIIAGELVMLAKFDKQAAAFGLPQLSTVPMPDGSVLTLHAVSYGTTHTLPVPIFPPGIHWRVQPANLRTINQSSNRNSVVFFVSRHDPETKDFLDFDWWSRCEVTGANDEPIQDRNPHRYVYTNQSSHSQGTGQRPFRPFKETVIGLQDKWRRIIIASEFPVFRANGPATLDFFDSDGRKVASLPFIPNWTPPATEWTPQPLPATVDQDPVSLVLTNARLKAHDRRSNDSKDGRRWQLECDARLLKDGKRAEHWSYGLQTVADVLGNDASPWDVTLSRNEPAWRVRFQATREAGADFTDDERVTISGVRVLEDNTFDTSLTSLEGQTAELVPVASAGIGKQEFQLPDYLGFNRQYSSGGNVPIASGNQKFAQYRLEWRYVGGPQGLLLSLETEAPCLILSNEGLPAGTQILVRTHDSQGREAPSHIRQFYDFAWLVFFDAEPEAGELTCELLLQTPLEFEFFIKPPEVATDTH